MNTQKKKSAFESNLSRLHTSMKKAILNEEVSMEIYPSDVDGYYAEMRVDFGCLKFNMSIATTFICYHNPFVKGMFDKEEDFEALMEIVNKYVRLLTSEEKAKIVALQAEIDAIKKGVQS